MGKKKSTSNGLTTTEIRRFRSMLLQKRNEILHDVSGMESGIERKDKGDPVNQYINLDDMGQENVEIDNTLSLLSSERKLIKEIDDALKRLDKGTYGICEGSGNVIPKARLKAIPWTRFCVEYAAKLESMGGGKKTFFEYDGNFIDISYAQDDDSSDGQEVFIRNILTNEKD